jgi:hypothetical protein
MVIVWMRVKARGKGDQNPGLASRAADKKTPDFLTFFEEFSKPFSFNKLMKLSGLKPS